MASLIGLGRIFLVLGLGGCAAVAAESARQQVLTGYTQQYEYQQPCDYIWPTVHQVLAERNLMLADTGPYTGQTNALADNTQAVQFFSQAIVTPNGGCRVVINRSSTWLNGANQVPRVERAIDLELAVLQRVDPQAAAQAQGIAAQEAERARAEYEARKAQQKAR